MTSLARLTRGRRVFWLVPIAVIVVGAIIAIFVLRSGGPPGHDTSLDRVRARGVLLVALDPSYPPFEVVNGQGKLAGYDVDLSREVAQRMGLKVQFVTIDFGAIFDALDVGKADTIVGGVSPFPEYAKTTTYSIPYFDAGQVLVVQPGAPGNVLGIESGSDADLDQDQLRKELPQYTFQQFDDQDQMRQLLGEKKLRAAVVDAVTGTQWSREIAGLELKPARLTSTPFVFAFRRNDNALRTAVNAALTALIRDGSVEQLTQKWLK